MTDPKKLLVEKFEPSMTVNELKKVQKGFGFADAEFDIVDEKAFAELLKRRRWAPDVKSIVRIKEGK